MSLLAMMPRLHRTRPCASFYRPLSTGRVAFVLWLAGSSLAIATNSPDSTTHRKGSVGGYEIVRLGRGHLNRLCLAANIEGTKGLMIVDTGASKTSLNSDKYKFLLPGPDRKLPPGVPTYVPVNNMTCPVGLARNFQIGDVNLGALPVALVGNNFLYDRQMLYQADSARQYDGLMGENLLRHYRAIVDCGRMTLYLNTDPARKANLGPALTRAGWTRIPMEDFGNDFAVPCTLGSHHFRMVVDTGAPFTTLDKDRLRITGLQSAEVRAHGGLIGTHGGEIGLLRIDNLKIGDYTAVNSQTVTLPGLAGVMERKQGTVANAPLLGLLGGNFLAANGAMVDVGDRALYLKRNDAAGSVSP